MLPDFTCPDIDDAQSAMRRLHWRATHRYYGRTRVADVLRSGLEALERLRESNRVLRREARMGTKKQLHILMYAAEALLAQTTALSESAEVVLEGDPLTEAIEALVSAVSGVVDELHDRTGHDEH